MFRGTDVAESLCRMNAWAIEHTIALVALRIGLEHHEPRVIQDSLHRLERDSTLQLRAALLLSEYLRLNWIDSQDREVRTT